MLEWATEVIGDLTEIHNEREEQDVNDTAAGIARYSLVECGDHLVTAQHEIEKNLEQIWCFIIRGGVVG